MVRTKFNNGNGKHNVNDDTPKPLGNNTVVRRLKLTPKQELFVQEYLIDLNATQAAIRARYSARNAGKIGPELLGNPRIRVAIDQAMAERSRRTGISQDRVLRELARIAFLNPSDVLNMDDASLKEGVGRDDTAAIAGVRVRKLPGKSGGMEREIKMHDKLRALELLGKHLGMFSDKLNVNADVAVKIVDDIGE